MNKKHFFLILGILFTSIFLKWQISFCQCITYAPGSTQKICQLSGEHDNEGVTNESQRNIIYTQNRTWTNWGIWGVDGGIPVEHEGILYFLFGDITEAFEGCPGTGGARDCIAYTTDTTPENGLSLTFLPPNAWDSWYGWKFHPFTILQFPYVFGPIRTDGMEGPVEGVSYNGNMYVYSTQGWYKDADDNGHFTRSVLAKSTDDGYTFNYLYDLSNSVIGGGTCKFTTQVMAKVVENTSDTAYNGIRKLLPAEVQNEPVLFIWGAGNPYRQSHVYLAYQPLNNIESRSSIRYYKGSGQWSTHEYDAEPLFEQMCPIRDANWNIIGYRPGMGEFSVAWNKYLNKWIMLYNFGCQSRGINFRVADYPWGPWGPNGVLLDPWEDNAYCHFMHASWNDNRCDYVDYVYDGVKIIDGQETKCDTDDDGVGDTSRKYIWGGEYGPFIINKFTTGVQNQWTTIYFTLSTWNPYQKVLMKTTLEVPRISVISPASGADWVTGSARTIEWDSSGFTGYVKIELCRPSACACSLITSSTSNDGAYSWSVPAPAENGCRIKVTSLSDTCFYGESGLFDIVGTTTTSIRSTTSTTSTRPTTSTTSARTTTSTTSIKPTTTTTRPTTTTTSINHAPSVTATMSFPGLYINKGDTVMLTASASDPDTGDILTYAWYVGWRPNLSTTQAWYPLDEPCWTSSQCSYVPTDYGFYIQFKCVVKDRAGTTAEDKTLEKWVYQ